MLCVTLILRIFTKLKATLSLFCTGPISHTCPVWLAPKVTKNSSQNISFHFHFFFYKINQNKNQIFGCGGSFPQLNSPLYLPWKEGKGSGCFCKTRSRTNLKVLQEDDQYWSLLHHQVLPLINMTNLICIFRSMTWKYISLIPTKIWQICPCVCQACWLWAVGFAKCILIHSPPPPPIFAPLCCFTQDTKGRMVDITFLFNIPFF